MKRKRLPDPPYGSYFCPGYDPCTFWTFRHWDYDNHLKDCPEAKKKKPRVEIRPRLPVDYGRLEPKQRMKAVRKIVSALGVNKAKVANLLIVDIGTVLAAEIKDFQPLDWEKIRKDQNLEQQNKYLKELLKVYKMKIKGLESSIDGLTTKIEFYMGEMAKLRRVIKSLSDSCLRNMNQTKTLKERYEKVEDLLNQTKNYYDQITRNIVEMIVKFPKNSSFRRSLIANLSKNLISKKRFINEIIAESGLNLRYLESIDAEDMDKLYELKYSLNPRKRIYWTAAELRSFDELIDELMPFLSGRNWRIRSYSKDYTYELYEDKMLSDPRFQGLRPMGYTTFWNHFEAKKDNVHFVKVLKHCPICNAIDAKEAGAELTEDQERLILQNPNHSQDIADAYNYYKSKKQKIVTDEDEDSVVIVQDFSQHTTSCGRRFQSLILTLYYYDPESKTLDHEFIHIFRHNRDDNETNKNDKWFTLSAWMYFFEFGIFSRWRKFYIVSDGCGGHFKNKEVHLFWFCLWKKYRNIIHVFEYAYFKSNHGNNPSDTAGSHAKRKLKFFSIRNKTIQVNDEFLVAGIIEMVNNHTTHVIDVYSEINGVIVQPIPHTRKCHLFRYDLEEKRVYLYSKGFDYTRGGVNSHRGYITYTDDEIQAMERVMDMIVDLFRSGGDDGEDEDEHDDEGEDAPSQNRPRRTRGRSQRSVAGRTRSQRVPDPSGRTRSRTARGRVDE